MEELGINSMQNDMQPVLGYVLSEVGQLGGRYEHNLVEPAQELRIQQFGCNIRGLVKSRHSSDIRQAGELQEARKKLPRVLTVEKVDNVELVQPDNGQRRISSALRSLSLYQGICPRRMNCLIPGLSGFSQSGRPSLLSGAPCKTVR